jgi:serine/threonine protein kinase
MATDSTNWIGLELAGGSYHVTAKLGEGGMGLVYRARDHNLDSDVIIKVPRRALLADEHFVERFAICYAAGKENWSVDKVDSRLRSRLKP